MLGAIVLVTGKEEFLAERTVAQAKEVVVAVDADAEFSDGIGSDLTMAALGELAAPSLFSTTRCVVIRELENVPNESHDELAAYAKDPADDVALLLVHGGGQKGSGLLTKLRKAGAVTEIKSEEVRPSELPQFVTAEIRRFGGNRLDPEVAQTLVQSVGSDLRSLSAAAHQLATDFPDQALTEELVQKYFGGRAEGKSFTIADDVFFGRRARALEELRWALQTGTPPVLVTSALVGSARALAKYAAAHGGMRDADLAREVGVPPWKLRTLRTQSQGWSDGKLALSLKYLAQADADIKGAASDPAYTLERLVLRLTGLHR